MLHREQQLQQVSADAARQHSLDQENWHQLQQQQAQSEAEADRQLQLEQERLQDLEDTQLQENLVRSFGSLPPASKARPNCLRELHSLESLPQRVAREFQISLAELSLDRV